MVLASQNAFDYISSLNDFSADRDVWFHVYPDFTHTGDPDPWMQRIWSNYKILTQDRQ